MAGLTQVTAEKDAVFSFINDYETVFDGFLSAQDFIDVFDVEIDIDALYEEFYMLVRLNVFQRCIMSYVNYSITDTDLQQTLRRFYLYFEGNFQYLIFFNTMPL